MTRQPSSILLGVLLTIALWPSIPTGAVASDSDPFAFSTDSRAGYDWWSLQPVTDPRPPGTRNSNWPRNEIDRFILSKLESEGIEPAPEADRRTLIRRLSFDLTGLPPSSGEVEAFGNETDPGAYEALVERLLDSPAYGERWARHWLDVIRFGETQGFERNRIRENGWRFRDWVVSALNQDLPYDEFVRRQVAGDVLYPDDLSALIATGYHVAGTWDQVGHKEGSKAMQAVAREDHLEDLVGTLGQSFLAMTVNCARCHDHKFDPISQKEYFQFAALLGGVHQEVEERSGIDRVPPHAAKVAVARGSLAEFEREMRARYSDDPEGAVEGLLAAWEFEGEADPNRLGPRLEGSSPPGWATSKPPKELILAIRQSGELTVEAWITPANTDQKGPARLVTLSRDSGTRNFTLGQEGDRWVMRLRTTKTSENGQPELQGGRVGTHRTHVAYTFDDEGFARLFVDGSRVAEERLGGSLENWDETFRLGLGNEFSGGREWRGEIHQVALYDRALSESEIEEHHHHPGRRRVPGESFDAIARRIDLAERRRWEELKQRVTNLEASDPNPQFNGVAHVLIPRQPPVFHLLERGNLNQPKEVVAPAGLRALKGLSPDFGLSPDAPEGERRRKLAEWLTDPRNPLTARVFVNRVWHYHFGRGLVDTPSDFGFSGGRPSHPELLDHLARRFMDGGWRIKDLHRWIVHSATYRQASNATNPVAEALDREGRWYWRFPLRRLEGECIRDAMLAVSGALNSRVGGPAFRDLETRLENNNHTFGLPTAEFDEDHQRRSLYRLWARSGNHPLLESLDCPDPSVMAPQRASTITPIQALSLLNNRFIEQCAALLAARVRSAAPEDSALADRVGHSYRLVLQRAPEPWESKLAEAFIAAHGLEQFCVVLFNSNEFLHVN